MSITTPPSSPEDSTSIADFSKTKTSEWIKQVQLESLESTKSELSCLNETVMKTPHHRSESASSKRVRGRKFVPGGLAEQLLSVIQRENSEITFWQHKAKRIEEKDVGRSTFA